MKNLLRAILSLLVVAALPLALIFADFRLPEIAGGDIREYTANVEPKPLQVYCPGGTVRSGGPNGTEPGVIEVVSGAAIGLNAKAGTVEVFQSKVSSGQSFTSLDTAAEQSTEVLSATQVSVANDNRISGLSAINCSQPVSSGYFLNGSTTVGTESILILSNPHQVEAVINLQLVLEPEKKARLVLPGGSQKYYNLSQIAPDAESFLLHFEASGPGVSVAMQQRTIDGLKPTGLDLSDSVSEPQTSQIFPVISSVGTLIAPEAGLAQSLLRVANPSSQSTQVRVQLTSVSESKTVVLDLAPQSILEKDLELAEGLWSAELESDIPVFAVIRNATFAQGIDFEWLQPIDEIQGQLFLSVASAFSLQLYNPGSAAINYLVNGQSISLAAQARLTIPVSSGILELEGPSIWAAASMLGQNGYGVIEPKENRNLGSDLKVIFQ